MSDPRAENPDEVQPIDQPVTEANEIESLRKALAEEKQKTEQYLGNWQRAQADYVNFKRRNEQEKAENTKQANAFLLANLLPVLDDLERALQNVDPQMADLPWVNGMNLIYRKFLAKLEAEGVKRIEAQGKDFDPRFHEAVLYERGEEGKVLEELETGYLLGDRLLRPVKVKVGKG